MRGYQNRKRKFNKTIWIASLKGSTEDKYGNEILEYDEPKKYKMNVQPLTAEADLKEFGINVDQYYKTIIEKSKYYGIFKEGDLAYLDGATPEREAKNGFHANYSLYPPRNQNKCICIFFKRINTKKNRLEPLTIKELNQMKVEKVDDISLKTLSGNRW